MSYLRKTQKYIYFDNAATSFHKPQEVYYSLKLAMEHYTANPGRSGHDLSQKSAEMVYETRELIKEFFNASNHEVVFTKNCTEALNLAIFGTLKKGDHVITTCHEHNSVLRPLEFLKNKGVQVTFLDCDLGDVDKNLVQFVLPNTKMVITTAVSNVTGEKTNLKNVGEICKKHDLIYLVDGAQGCGHIDIDMEKMNIDMLAFAGHKGMLAITGVGGLILKSSLKLQPILFGGTGTNSESLCQPTQIPEGFETGTLPVIPISTLNAGVKVLIKNFKIYHKIEENLSNYLYFCLKNLKFLKIYSKENSFNVFSFNIINQDSMVVANFLNDYGICVRAGLHCAPLIHKKLGTLEMGAVRVSLDYFNTKEEIDYLVEVLAKINSQLNS